MKPCLAAFLRGLYRCIKSWQCPNPIASTIFLPIFRQVLIHGSLIHSPRSSLSTRERYGIHGRSIEPTQKRVLKPGEFIPGTTYRDILLSVLPTWPLTAYKLPRDSISGAPVVLAEALRSPDCSLLAGSKSVMGEQCAIFDYKGIEQMWIAANKGLCLMRRDVRDARSRQLRTSIVTDKISQIAPGLWLPSEYRFQAFSPGRSTDHPSIMFENKVRILRCLLNDDVPRWHFMPRERPGSVEYGRDGSFIQVCRGGEDLLDDVVKFAVTCAHLPRASLSESRSHIWFAGALSCGLTSGLLSVGMAKRGAKRKIRQCHGQGKGVKP